MAAAPYRWSFYRSGGVDQVALQSRDDLLHLAELDPKLWIALSMPTRGVELDPRTLDLLDTDHDGHVRHPEVLAALAWTRTVYKDLGRLFEGGDTIPLDALHDGAVLLGARRLLANLGKPDASEVSLADATSAEEVFANTRFNGDGVIIPACAEDDARAVIAEIMTTHGSAGVMLAISAPSMLLAFIKLRRRNLGPLLDANGWAINALTRINVPFGSALTDVAALPPGAHRSARDPYAEKRRPWRLYLSLLIVVVLALAWLFGRLDGYLPGPLRSTSVLGPLAPAWVAPAPAGAPDPTASTSTPPAPPPRAGVPARPALIPTSRAKRK